MQQGSVGAALAEASERVVTLLRRGKAGREAASRALRDS